MIRTDGDVLTGSLSSLGGAGVFVAALREAVLDGRCELAVHSLKDLPAAAWPGLTLFTPPREDPHDVLCAPTGVTWDTLRQGARVGTGSPRRAAQLLALRPDVNIVDIRGNVDTRLARALGPEADLDAVVLARAGLARLGRLDAVSTVFDSADMTPAPGQGALAIEASDDALADPAVATALAAIDDESTHLAVAAERALLEHLGAGCAAPVGALGTLTGATMNLLAAIVSLDGTRRLVRSMDVSMDASDRQATARQLGIDLAEALLNEGAADIAPLGM